MHIVWYDLLSPRSLCSLCLLYLRHWITQSLPGLEMGIYDLLMPILESKYRIWKFIKWYVRLFHTNIEFKTWYMSLLYSIIYEPLMTIWRTWLSIIILGHLGVNRPYLLFCKVVHTSFWQRGEDLVHAVSFLPASLHHTGRSSILLLSYL